jgi:hypothetical protein
MISLIKHKNNILGLVDNRNKPYVIGFSDRRIAQYVKDNISLDPICEIKRGIIYDVSDELNSGLRSLGVSYDTYDITVDVNARLIINKKLINNNKKNNKKQQQQQNKFIIEDIEFGDFLMYPIEKTIGIILPILIMDEDNKKIYFDSQVIDAAIDMDTIKKNLNNIFIS